MTSGRKKAILGNKVRRLRRQRGVTQTALAGELGISPSYLNLIEHNQRPVTVPLLIKLAQALEVDVAGFADHDEAQLLSDLREVFGDSLFRGRDIGLSELRELVAAAPEAGRAVLDLYGAYSRVCDDRAALFERLDGGDGPSGATAASRLASEEITDFVQSRANHFPELEEAAERLWREARLEYGDVHAGLVRHLDESLGVRVRIAPFAESAGAVRRYEERERAIMLSEVLPQSSRNFQLANQIALLQYRAMIDRCLEGTRFANPDTPALARVALANYFAGAVLMPYEAFLGAARDLRCDIDIIEHRFGVSFEQACHRLTTLQRPGARGVPLHFVRVDIAGNISKRFSASGIQISRQGGACPRWNVYDAFMSPGLIRTQVSRTSDGATYFCIARTVQKQGGGYWQRQSYLAIGLGCRIEDARAFVYADSVDLENPDAAVSIGVNCRICERLDCRQRAFPPIHHRINVDENVRGYSAYVTPVAPHAAAAPRAPAEGRP